MRIGLVLAAAMVASSGLAQTAEAVPAVTQATAAPREPLREISRSPQVVMFMGEPRPASDGRIHAWAWMFMKDVQADGSTNGYTTLNEVDCAARTSRVVVMGKYFHTMHMSSVNGEAIATTRSPGSAGAAIITAACNYTRLQTPVQTGPDEARATADSHFGR